MIVMFHLVNIASVIFEAYILAIFFATICESKCFKKLYNFLIYSIFVVILSLVYLFYNDAFTKLVTSFICVILLSLVYRMKRNQQVLGVIIIFVIITLFEYVVGFCLSAILSRTVVQIVGNIVFYSVGVLASKLLAFGCVKIFAFKYQKQEMRVSNKQLILFAVFPLVTFIVGIVLIGNLGQNLDIVFSIIGACAMILLVGANVLVFYLFEAYSDQLNKRYNNEIERQKLTREKVYLQALIDKQTQSNKVMHDLKNQLFAIREMVEDDNKKGLLRINEICQDVAMKQNVKYTENVSVDALINSKKQQMDDHGIAFSCLSYLSGFGFIEEMDLCVLIGNLLDNAIEACMKLDSKRQIKMDFRQQGNYMNIEIENTASGAVIIDSNQVPTSKKEKHIHGFGLKSIKSIAEKYCGSMEIASDEEKFVVSLMLIMDKIAS